MKKIGFFQIRIKRLSLTGHSTRAGISTTVLWKQDSFDGYTGDDIIEIATILEVTPRGLRRRLNNWINSDDDFQQFIYLGKKKPPLTLFEFFKIEQGLESNPIQVKKGMYEDIQEERKIRDQEPLAKTTFYRCVNQKILSMYSLEIKSNRVNFIQKYYPGASFYISS